MRKVVIKTASTVCAAVCFALSLTFQAFADGEAKADGGSADYKKAVITAFHTAASDTAIDKNLISSPDFENPDGALWNTTDFLKPGVMERIENTEYAASGAYSLYFHPNGEETQTVYFPITLEADTEYMLSFAVRGRFFGSENRTDATYGIMNPVTKEYITAENPIKGEYYDETPNSTAERALTPPAWDNMWHRRGYFFNTGSETDFLIAVSGTVSQIYFDDIRLCRAKDAVRPQKSETEKLSVTETADFAPSGDADNYDSRWDESAEINAWGYGRFARRTSLETGEDGQKYIMCSSGGYRPSHSSYIKWFSVLPGKSYLVSFESRAESGGAVFIAGGKGGTVYQAAEFQNANSNVWKKHCAYVYSGGENEIGIMLRDNGKTTAVRNIVIISDTYGRRYENNLIPNGDFESGSLNGYSVTGNKADFVLTDEESYNGAYSLKIEANIRYDYISKTVNVKKNTYYTVSFYGKRAEETGSAIWKVLNADTMQPIDGTENNYWVNAYGRWEINRVTFYSGSCGKIKICFTEDTGIAFADDIRIKESNEYKSDFEAGFAEGFEINGSREDFTVTDSESHSGAYSLKIAANNRYDCISKTVNVERNTYYTVSFYGKRTEETGSAIWKILNADTMQPIDGTENNYWVNAYGRWEINRVTFYSGSCGKIKICFAEDSAEAYIDDIVIEKNVFHNGGFEAGDLNGFEISGNTEDFILTDEDSHSGRYSLKIAANNRYDSISKTMDVKKGTYYTVSFYGKRTEETGSAIWKVLNAGTMQPLDGTESNYWVNAYDKWEINRVTFNSGASERIKLYFAEDTASVYIDDITVTEYAEISVTCSSGGSLAGAPNGTYEVGDTVKFSAVAHAGYVFTGWYNGDTFLTDNTEYVAAATANTELYAEFLPSVGTAYGDVNGDDSINSEDLTMLREYLIGACDVVAAGADINRDANVDILDLIKLKKLSVVTDI